jgi:Raf kinase inhibitor-like YbhB/YbcL family protein
VELFLRREYFHAFRNSFGENKLLMKLNSPDFQNGEAIPERFSQFSDNHSPPLKFVDVPKAARSLALIMDDPDAPHGTFTHWIAFNIHAEIGGFPENQLPENIQLGRNSLGEAAYAGPKPPNGEHRYFFHAYALDSRLELPDGINRKMVERAMEGHIIDHAELMGRFATLA